MSSLKISALVDMSNKNSGYTFEPLRSNHFGAWGAPKVTPPVAVPATIPEVVEPPPKEVPEIKVVNTDQTKESD